MSEAPRLFRDFVEKLERAYIAFDGVVGSCLGRAWGGSNYGAERTTTLTLFRKTQNPISRNAPHSLSFSLSLLSLPPSLFGPNVSSLLRSYPSVLSGVFHTSFLIPSLYLHSTLRFQFSPAERESKEGFNGSSVSAVRGLSLFSFPSLSAFLFLSWLSLIFQPVPCTVVLPLGWYQFWDGIGLQ